MRTDLKYTYSVIAVIALGMLLLPSLVLPSLTVAASTGASTSQGKPTMLIFPSYHGYGIQYVGHDVLVIAYNLPPNAAYNVEAFGITSELFVNQYVHSGMTGPNGVAIFMFQVTPAYAQGVGQTYAVVSIGISIPPAPWGGGDIVSQDLIVLPSTSG